MRLHGDRNRLVLDQLQQFEFNLGFLRVGRRQLSGPGQGIDGTGIAVGGDRIGVGIAPGLAPAIGMPVGLGKRVARGQRLEDPVGGTGLAAIDGVPQCGSQGRNEVVAGIAADYRQPLVHAVIARQQSLDRLQIVAVVIEQLLQQRQFQPIDIVLAGGPGFRPLFAPAGRNKRIIPYLRLTITQIHALSGQAGRFDLDRRAVEHPFRYQPAPALGDEYRHHRCPWLERGSR